MTEYMHSQRLRDSKSSSEQLRAAPSSSEQLSGGGSRPPLTSPEANTIIEGRHVVWFPILTLALFFAERYLRLAVHRDAGSYKHVYD